MLRLTNNLTKLSMNIEPLNTNLQIVRWRRKPRWLPTAKSKLYRIPTRPVIPEDETEELKRLNNNYRNHMKSIRRFLVAKYMKDQKMDDTHHRSKIALADFEHCKMLNDEWNVSVRVDREKFFHEELQKDIETAKQKLEFQQFKLAMKMEEAENVVRKQKEQAKDFITPDNIDAAIEHALANVVDYNFAIDLDGNKYHGRETVPDKQEKEKSKDAVKL